VINQYLDHIIWAAPNLGRATERFTELTGVRPQYGGRHASGLTHNALVALSARCYLEILAPTGDDASHDDEWSRFARATPEPRLLTYCMRSPLPLHELAPLAAAEGRSLGSVAANGRTTPDGVALSWQWLAPKQATFGRAFPFFIDWQNSPHPAESFAAAQPDAAHATSAIRLAHFAVGHPEAASLAALLTRLGSPIDTYVAPDLEFQLHLDTPRGTVTL
jgi:hypothetical protein